jgi:uncharacterized protein YprB with RNaseH-like and TPR domain
MFSEDKLKKLESLAGKIGAKGKIRLGSDWANDSQSQPISQIEKPKQMSLEESVPGKIVKVSSGKYYHIERPLKSAWTKASHISNLFRNVFFGSGQILSSDQLSEEYFLLTSADPSEITFFDIETCGLAGNTVFLIGWGWYEKTIDDFIVVQAFARDYAEEGAILESAFERLNKTSVVVTFNGKRFDIPFVRDRAIIYRLTPPSVPHHLDMLLEVRKRWRKQIPNCQLQTIERILCKRSRQGDIEGSAIPDAYHEFVKTTHSTKLRSIIHHNFLDVVTLGEITMRILAGEEPEL